MKYPARNLLGLGLAALLTAATVATAAARPDTRNMSCEQTQRLIIRNGAVVLTTGAHTYDRYVAGYGYCSYPDEATQTYVRTRDTSQCPVLNCQYSEPPIWND